MLGESPLGQWDQAAVKVEGKKGRGRPLKTWKECVRKDRKDRDLLDVDPEDKPVWRSAVYASRLLPTRTRELNAAV